MVVEHRDFNILVVEDNPGDAKQLSYLLEDVEQDTFMLSVAGTLAAGIVCLDEQNYDVILLDLSLPDSRGLETLLRLKKVDSDTPVVILTGLKDEQTGLQAVQYGAQDFLVKGGSSGEMIARCIRYAVERQETQKKLAYLAHYDQLTGLANRTLAQECLERALEKARRSQRCVGLFYMDLDRFKVVNDTLGHAFGDELLRVVARRIRRSLRRSETIGRIGGDEFLLIIEDLASIYQASAVAEKLLTQLSPPIRLHERDIFITASIGIAMFPDCGVSPDELTKNADSAMYNAKEKGGNTYVYFCPTMNDSALQRLQLESDLRGAIRKDEFYLVFQPQVDIRSRKLVGIETLIRWQHPQKGLISPKEFIPIAEENGLIFDIGAWVLKNACLQQKLWSEAGLHGLRVSVNVSHRQLEQPKFLTLVEAVLRETGIQASLLVFEITESSLMDQRESSIATLNALHELGIEISIDDFGTGYSSLYKLKHMPVDGLKIDQSFVQDIGVNEDDAEIVRTIIQMARNLRLQVVAEGVESTHQLAFLAENGCDLIQGNLFGEPMAADGIARLLDASGYAVLNDQGAAGIS